MQNELTVSTMRERGKRNDVSTLMETELIDAAKLMANVMTDPITLVQSEMTDSIGFIGSDIMLNFTR